MFLSINRRFLRQWFAVLLANSSMFLAGTCIGWSSPSLVKLQSPENQFLVTNDDASWIASIFNMGSAFGTIVGSTIIKKFGPKKSLTFSAIPYMAGLALLAMCGSVSQLIIGRVLLGFGASFAFVSLPIYISQIGEIKIRGSLMVSYSISVCMGILFITCVGPYVSVRIMAFITFSIPIILIMTYFIPESPHFLFLKERDREAIESLKYFRDANNENELKEEIDTIKSCLQDNQNIWRCMLDVKVKPNGKILGIIGCIIAAQQFGGCVPVAYYQEQILRSANIPISAEIGAIITQVSYIISGVISMFFVGNFGRKTILTVMTFTSTISLLTLGIYFSLYSWFQQFPILCWLPLICIMIIFFSFIAGLGSMPYLIINEMTLSNFKEIALSFSSIVGSLIGSTISKLFQMITDAFGIEFAFYSLGIFSSIFLVINLYIIPETKNKSTVEIQRKLKCEKNEIP